ncbi:MAG: NAD(+) synthase [Lachnospiraceae bacterium]|nr:NAD(+) synthase [Lachnospiraceae bacterium]
MDYGFRRISCATFDIKIGDVKTNTEHILELIDTEQAKDTDVLVFPELCLTGYTCADMFLRRELTAAAEAGLCDITDETSGSDMIVVVGLPIRSEGKLFNCAAIICDGKILAVVPKTYLPNYNEFYEKRWFASANDAACDRVYICGQEVLFGNDILIETSDGLKLGCEICEDLWVTTPPSDRLAAAGANLIVNPSASNDIVSKREYRLKLVSMQSASCNVAYAYASAGSGESTTDVIYSGHQIIAECGSVKAQNYSYYLNEPMVTSALIDIEKIDNDQVRLNSYKPEFIQGVRSVRVDRSALEDVLPASVNAYPFVPSDVVRRKERCEEILSLQAAGLATRLRKTGMKKAVIGISGGLDSTLALLVTAEAFDMVGYPHSDIIAITMPGFGTTRQTKTSADHLMELIGADARTIDITAACRQHMADIGQPEDCYDVTYENIQARERTQILMDVANKNGGLVIGTGDLSELALGWCTYNGDHMSMYAVNVSIPKTLVRFIIETYAYEKASPAMRDVLIGVCNTIISPELLPPDENGNIKQSTEDTIGKYDLHDFFLYNYVRNGFPKDKLRALAYTAFPQICHKQVDDTLKTFMIRFRTNQFKRNCIPDGPKVGSVALSPRGDWRMPSDYS